MRNKRKVPGLKEIRGSVNWQKVHKGRGINRIVNSEFEMSAGLVASLERTVFNVILDESCIMNEFD